MRVAFGTSGLIIIIGLFNLFYGLLSFNLRISIGGLILLWMGVSLYGHFLETQRLYGNGIGQGNNVI